MIRGVAGENDEISDSSIYGIELVLRVFRRRDPEYGNERGRQRVNGQEPR